MHRTHMLRMIGLACGLALIGCVTDNDLYRGSDAQSEIDVEFNDGLNFGDVDGANTPDVPQFPDLGEVVQPPTPDALVEMIDPDAQEPVQFDGSMVVPHTDAFIPVVVDAAGGEVDAMELDAAFIQPDGRVADAVVPLLPDGSLPSADARPPTPDVFVAPLDAAPLQEDASPDLGLPVDVGLPVDAVLVMPDAADPIDALAIVDAMQTPDAALPMLDAAVSVLDAAVVDPLDVDNDHDGFTENQQDCNDTDPLVKPNALEQCLDRIDNNCNGDVDHQDVSCGPSPDTSVTIETRGAPPAMVLTLQSYTDVNDLSGNAQVTSQVVNEALVQATLDADAFPPDAFCGLILQVALYTDRDDIDGNGRIVGDPNQFLCQLNAQGQPVLDETLRRVLVVVNRVEFDASALVPLVVPGVSGCRAALVLWNDGVCDLANVP